MSENKKVTVSSRTFAFFIGVFLCLLAVILIMNVGYPARMIAFPFFYSFGVGSYAVYLLLYAIGISYLFRGRSIKFRANLRFFGVILLFICFLAMNTLIICKDDGINQNFFTQYNNLLFEKSSDPTILNFADKGGYWDIGFINMYSDFHFAGGLVGYAITGLLVPNVTNGGAYAIIIILSILSLVLIFFKQIKKLVLLFVNRSRKEENNAKPVNETKSLETSIEEIDEPVFESRRDFSNYSEKQMIKSASQLEEAIYRESSISLDSIPVMEKANAMKKSSEPQSIRNSLYPPSSAFVPARFIMHGPLENIDTSINNTEPEYEEEEVQPEQILLESQKEVTKNEQLTLDFDAKQESFEEETPTVMEENKPVAPKVEVVKPAVISKPIIKKKAKWIPPSVQLLEDMKVDEALDTNNQKAIERMETINSIFQDFGIGATCVGYVVGPSVTNFKIKYESNVTVKSVNNIIQDISVRLGGVAARFEGIVEGTHYSGIEVSNVISTPVSFKEVYENLPDAKKKPLAVGFGKNIEGRIISADFAEFPHVLVAGTTGSGKSIFIHSIICTLIMRNSPYDLKLVLIDPKQVEMASYRDIPHLLCPVITDVKKAKGIMDKLVTEMNDRYALFEENVVRSITEYNELAAENGKEKLPYIVVIIDEYADLVQICKDISAPVVSIAQKARAAGIHMLISTQRPSTDVITGVIKGNLPTRVALSVSSPVDSTTVLGVGGAEALCGKGDMLVLSPLVSRVGPVRLQGCYIKSKEMRYIIGYLKEHYPVEYDPKYLNLEEEATKDGEDFVNSPAFSFDGDEDEEKKYRSVKEWVMSNKYMSMSRIQRECAVGFNRAGRFFKRLQDEGVIGTEPDGNKGCPVLTNDAYYDNDNVVTSNELTRN